MEKEDLIFREYKLYSEQKDKFVDRNFSTNRFYMISLVVIIFAMIYTSSVVFMGKFTATLLFSLLGVAVCVLWWMNVDSYNTLIKIKYSNVIEEIEKNLPVKPYTDEYKGIEEFKNKKIFMFSDIQKIIAAVSALFFFAVFVSELTPVLAGFWDKIFEVISSSKGGI